MHLILQTQNTDYEPTTSSVQTASKSGLPSAITMKLAWTGQQEEEIKKKVGRDQNHTFKNEEQSEMIYLKKWVSEMGCPEIIWQNLDEFEALQLIVEWNVLDYRLLLSKELVHNILHRLRSSGGQDQ